MTPDQGLYYEVLQRLNQEADLLDTGCLEEWLELLTEDVVYEMPARVTRERGSKDHFTQASHFLDTRATLQTRVERLKTDFAWAEDPPSRTRHLISNVRVLPPETDAEIPVRSAFVTYRYRSNSAQPEMISGERHDVWRRTEGGLRLARRRILTDQVVLQARNLAILL